VRQRMRWLAVVACSLVGAVVSLCPALGVASYAAGSKGQSSGALSLVAPPAYVSPDQSFLARLAIGSDLDRSSLSLEVTLYRELSTRSGLEHTFNGTPDSPVISRSETPIELAALPADPSDPRAVDLTVPVDAAGETTPQPGPFTADLGCVIGNCAGVYPLRIALFESGSSSYVAELLTYLVYAVTPVTQPLRFSLVVPVSMPVQQATSSGAVALPQSSELSKLDALVDTISGSKVPLTVEPDPETVSALASDVSARSATSARSGETLVAMRALATSAGRETLCGPFADVDAGQLVSAGLSGELSNQVSEGESVLEGAPLHLSCPSSRTWVSAGPLNQSALNTLAGLGYEAVVVPQNAVSGAAPSTTWTQLVGLGDTASEALPAKTIDPGVSTRLQPGPHADPALAADQVLAELELAYFERPATEVPRGVVAVAPSSWGTETSFVADLLGGLEQNPIVRGVTLSDIFSEVPVGGTPGAPPLQPSTRKPSAAVSSGSLPAGVIKSARARVSGFSSAVSALSLAGASEAEVLNHLLLAAESSTLDARQQQAAVTSVSNALDDQLRSLSVNAGEIRLTSNAAPVPITVVKRLPYPVTVVVGVTSDKLAFPPGSQDPGSSCRGTAVNSSAGRSSFSSTCVVDHPTNVIYVHMRSRASGDFRISVTLTSPADSLVLTSGQITVRSLSTSAVATAISVVAVVVLLAWWGRTYMRRRQSRRPAHGRGAHAPA